MLHEKNFLHDTDWNFYFMDTSLRGIEHSENTIVTANPINSCKIQVEMSSIGKPVADDDASTLANQSNGGVYGITNLEISSFRKSKANDQPNNDCEFRIVNESQASLKLGNAPDFEAHPTLLCQEIKEDSKVLPPSTTRKPDSPRTTIATCGDSVSEIRTCISYSPQNAGNIIRDIPVYDETTSKDKLSIVSGSSAVTEKMPNFKISGENELNYHEHVSEMMLKMIEMKDAKIVFEEPRASVVEELGEEGLTQSHQDDKLILEESFILHTSSFEEGHVCNSSDLADNVKHRGTGSRPDDCINGSSSFPLDKTENILKDREKDTDGDRESIFFSTYQNEIKLTTPVRTSQKGVVFDSKSEIDLTIPGRISQKESVYVSKAHSECLDVRLDSSSESTLCKEENHAETVTAVKFSGDDEARVHPSNCETRSDECILFHDTNPGENCRDSSDESHLLEISTLNDQNVERDELPNNNTLNGAKTGINPYVVVDNPPSQGRPLTVSEKKGDGDRESGSLSNHQKETDLISPVRICQKENAYALKSNTECLDVRLESSSEGRLCQDDNHIETDMAVQFLGDDRSRVHPADSETTSKVPNCDTAKKSVSDNLFPSELVSVNTVLKINPENQRPETDPGFSGHSVIEGKVERSIVVAEQDLRADDQISHILLHPTKVSIKTCDLTERTSTNPEVTNFDTAKKPASNNLPTSELVSINTGLKINPENQRPEADPGSGHLVIEGKAEQSIVVALQNLRADDQISPVLLYPTKESIKTSDSTEKTSIALEVANYDTAEKTNSDNSPLSKVESVNTDLKINPETQRPETDPGFSSQSNLVREGKAEQSIVATEHRSICNDQGTVVPTHSRKECNGTCAITEKLLNDTKATNHSSSEMCVVNNDSSPVTDIDPRKNATERGVLTSGFSGQPVSSAYPSRSSHESVSGHPVSSVNGGRNSHESPYDAFDDTIGNSDLAESFRYTYSGPISGPISYSGPIPFSGNISHRSDSSTTSTRSFAFPILPSEWNSSPVKMTQADPRYYRKKRGWQFLCFCGGSTSPD